MISLHFKGPYPLCSDTEDVLGDCPIRDEQGIYLWAARTRNQGYVCTYLGETSRSFYARTKEHAIQTLGGNYEILDPAEMIEGRVCEVWKGLWRKGTTHRLHEYLRNLAQLSDVARRFLLAQAVFLAPCELETRLRRRIEGALAATVRESVPRLLPMDVRYVSRLASEDPMLVSLSADQPIHGLRPQFEA